MEPKNEIVAKAPNWEGISEPDVWWGKDGIDGLLWADPPPPYAKPPSNTDPQNTAASARTYQ